MSWIISDPEKAREAGCDMEGQEIMSAILVEYIAEMFDSYQNYQLGTEEVDPKISYWERLPENHREAYLNAVSAFIESYLREWDNGIDEVFYQARERLEGETAAAELP